MEFHLESFFEDLLNRLGPDDAFTISDIHYFVRRELDYAFLSGAVDEQWYREFLKK